MKNKKFMTQRLILRQLESSDYEAWFDCYVNRWPAKSRWDAKPFSSRKCTRAHFKKHLKTLRSLAKKDEYYRFWVFEKKSGMIVGQIDFDIYVRGTHQFANFGYQIFNRFWGLGFGQESSKLGLKIGFEYLKLNRLEAAINLDNRKSIRLAKVIGMRKEGLKKRYWYEDGKWVDHLIYVANPEDIGLLSKHPKD